MSTLRNLLPDSVQDPAARQALRWIQDYIKEVTILKGEFQFLELEFLKAETELKIAHNLKFIPLDILTTSLTGSGTVTWNYGLFDEKNINVTTSGACKVRFLAGKLK